MWAMLAAPLMVSVNLSTLSPPSLATLTNPQMIAIDQDKKGRQGVQVAPAAVASTPASANGEAWIKPLEHGKYAVALLNIGDSTLTISTSASAIGIPSASSYNLANVWAGGTSSTSGAISASVPSDSTVVFIVSPG